MGGPPLPTGPARAIDAQGGFDPPPQAGEKCIGWVEKREKKERKGENQAKIGKIRLKIEKRGENRRKSSNLAKNR